MDPSEGFVVFRHDGKDVAVPAGGMIGRSASAALVVDHPYVSEFHAGVSVRDDGMVLLPLRGAIWHKGERVPVAGLPLDGVEEVELGSVSPGAPPRVPLRVVSVSAPPARLFLVGLGDATLPLPADAEMAFTLVPEWPYAGPPGGLPAVWRAGGKVWLSTTLDGDAGSARELTTAGEVMVRFPGKPPWFLKLVERPRGAKPPTATLPAVDIVVSRGAADGVSVWVTPLDRPGVAPFVVQGRGGAFAAEVLRRSAKGTVLVGAAVAAVALRQGNTEAWARSALNEARKALGPLEGLLVTVPASDPLSGGVQAIRVVLPPGSQVSFVDEAG